jgi:hypothetical protein
MIIYKDMSYETWSSFQQNQTNIGDATLEFLNFLMKQKLEIFWLQTLFSKVGRNVYGYLLAKKCVANLKCCMIKNNPADSELSAECVIFQEIRSDESGWNGLTETQYIQDANIASWQHFSLQNPSTFLSCLMYISKPSELHLQTQLLAKGTEVRLPQPDTSK